MLSGLLNEAKTFIKPSISLEDNFLSILDINNSLLYVKFSIDLYNVSLLSLYIFLSIL